VLTLLGRLPTISIQYIVVRAGRTVLASGVSSKRVTDSRRSPESTPPGRHCTYNRDQLFVVRCARPEKTLGFARPPWPADRSQIWINPKHSQIANSWEILRQIQAVAWSSTLLSAGLVREHKADYDIDKERQRRPALPHLPRSSLGALAVVIRSVLKGILPPDISY
jgi:hypothetical protein